MKVLVALCALMAVATAAPFNFLPYSAGLPLTYGTGIPLSYSAPLIQPEITTYSVKPVQKEVDVIQDGYVAITPGAKHIAPLPYGGASHHVNLKKAPGTK